MSSDVLECVNAWNRQRWNVERRVRLDDQLLRAGQGRPAQRAANFGVRREGRRAIGQRRRLQKRADDRRDVLGNDLMRGLRLEPDAEQRDLLLCEKAWFALLRLG